MAKPFICGRIQRCHWKALGSEKVPAPMHHNLLIGNMDNLCLFFYAFKFKKERAGMCCSNGKVFLPCIDYPSEPLQSLVSGATPLSKHWKNTEKTLNTCIRFICNVSKYDHITTHKNDLNLLTMHHRRTLHIASLTNKIICNGAPGYLNYLIEINIQNTRSSNKLIIQQPSNNLHKQSFFIGAPKIFNNLPEDIRTITKNKIFKETLHSYLLNNKKNKR